MSVTPSCDDVERDGGLRGAVGSRLAVPGRGAGPAQYHEKPRLLSGCYSYWSGLPMNGRFTTQLATLEPRLWPFAWRRAVGRRELSAGGRRLSSSRSSVCGSHSQPVAG